MREKPPAEVTTKEMQSVVERPKHPHQRRRFLHTQVEMVLRVKNQRRIKNRKPQRRKDLDKEQHRRSFRSFGETVFERLHWRPFRSLTRTMSSNPWGRTGQ